MSLYDLFEHTEFLIVPPAPDDWSDWHFYVKTFGLDIVTALFTGTIAILAYRIAKTQREIAANNYNLDLFDKRYEIFDKIRPVYEKFKHIKFDDYKIIDNNDNVKIYKLRDISFKENTIIDNVDKFLNIKIISIKKELKKVPRIFSNIDMIDIDKILTLFSVIESDKKELVCNILNIKEKYDHENIRKEIKNIFQKSNEKIKNENICFYSENISGAKQDLKICSLKEESLKKINDINNITDYIIQQKETIESIEKDFIDESNRMNDYNEKLTEIHNNMKIIENIFTKIYKEMDNQLNISHTPY